MRPVREAEKSIRVLTPDELGRPRPALETHSKDPVVRKASQPGEVMGIF